MSLTQPIRPRITAVPRVVVPDRTYWGLRSPDATADARQRSRLFSIHLPPHAFFTHTTAARLYGIPLPLRLTSDERLHVTVAAPGRAPHGRGIVGHGLKIRHTELAQIGHLSLTGPERTWCDLGAMLPLADLVAAGDFLIHWQDPFTTQYQLAEAIEELPCRRYVRILRTAVALLSDRSDSPPESILRVVLAAGRFPAPVITRVVSDGYGEYIAHTHFLIEELGLLLRYRSADVRGQIDDPYGPAARDEDDPTTLLVIELDSDDLRDPAGLIDRIWSEVRAHAVPGY